MSRHYYDLHCLAASEPGRRALTDGAMGEDCVKHARMFFDRPDYDLASALPGTFALLPHDAMAGALRNDYENTRAMIFGDFPAFDTILSSIANIEAKLNGPR